MFDLCQVVVRRTLNLNIYKGTERSAFDTKATNNCSMFLPSHLKVGEGHGHERDAHWLRSLTTR